MRGTSTIPMDMPNKMRRSSVVRRTMNINSDTSWYRAMNQAWPSASVWSQTLPWTWVAVQTILISTASVTTCFLPASEHARGAASSNWTSGDQPTKRAKHTRLNLWRARPQGLQLLNVSCYCCAFTCLPLPFLSGIWHGHEWTWGVTPMPLI